MNDDDLIATGTARDPLPFVVSVKALDHYQLLLGWSNGEQRLFDVKPLFVFPVFQPLKNIEFFKLVKVAYGSIEWPKNIDYCPDTLYNQSIPIEQS